MTSRSVAATATGRSWLSTSFVAVSQTSSARPSFVRHLTSSEAISPAALIDSRKLREDAHLAHPFRDHVRGPVLREEARKPLGRDVVGDVGWVASLTCLGDRVRIDVGGKNQDGRSRAEPGEALLHEYPEGVGFLARGAPWHPDSHALVRALRREDVGQDVDREMLEGLGIAKELGDSNEEILGQELGFLRVLVEEVDVLVQ